MPDPIFDIITIADSNVDLIVDLGNVVPRFGQVEQWVPGYALEMGGSACIFASQAAKLRLPTAILGVVGDDDFGRLILGRLEEAGVDTRFMRVERNIKTGLGLALTRETGDRAILTYSGSINAVTHADVGSDFIASGRHFHYGSYYLQTNLLPEAVRMLRRIKDAGLTLSLDTNWDPTETWGGGLAEALPLVDVFLPNATEALAITGAGSVEEAVRRLVEVCPLVVVKDGARGAWVGDRTRVFHVPVQPVEVVVDTIGAGDSFDAGFLAGWLRGLALEDCARMGNECGRATLRAHGGIEGQLQKTL